MVIRNSKGQFKKSSRGLRDLGENFLDNITLAGSKLGNNVKKRALPYALMGGLVLGGMGYCSGNSGKDELEEKLDYTQTELIEEKNLTNSLNSRVNDLNAVVDSVSDQNTSLFYEVDELKKVVAEKDSVHSVKRDSLNDYWTEELVRATNDNNEKYNQLVSNMKVLEKISEAPLIVKSAAKKNQKDNKEIEVKNYVGAIDENDGEYSYRVQSGDTFWKIKEKGFEPKIEKYDLTYDDFTVNGDRIANPDSIFVGDVIEFVPKIEKEISTKEKSVEPTFEQETTGGEGKISRDEKNDNSTNLGIKWSDKYSDLGFGFTGSLEKRFDAFGKEDMIGLGPFATRYGGRDFDFGGKASIGGEYLRGSLLLGSSNKNINGKTENQGILGGSIIGTIPHTENLKWELGANINGIRQGFENFEDRLSPFATISYEFCGDGKMRESRPIVPKLKSSYGDSLYTAFENLTTEELISKGDSLMNRLEELYSEKKALEDSIYATDYTYVDSLVEETEDLVRTIQEFDNKSIFDGSYVAPEILDPSFPDLSELISEKDVQQIPRWYYNVPTSEDTLYSVGTGVSKDLQLSRDKARMNAEKSLIGSIQSSDLNKSGVLSGAETIKNYYETMGDYYKSSILIGIPKDKLE